MDSVEKDDSEDLILEDAESPVSETVESGEEQIVVPASNDGFDDLFGTFEESSIEVTEIYTPSGTITVVHEITLGDLILATLLASILIVNIMSKLIRRF